MLTKMIETKLLPGIFIAFIFLFGGYLYLSPDQEVSFVEYRTLKQKPEMTVENMVNGEFVKDYEEYFTDQFPGRNFWLKTYLKLQQFSGKTFINGYYVSEDGWILPKPQLKISEPSLRRSSKNVNAFADFANSNGSEVYFFALPNKVNMVKIDQPSYIEEGIEEETKQYFLSRLSKENLNVVDIGKNFQDKYSQKEINDMYFKTDHHWNSKGSYNGYKEITDYLKSHSKYFNVVEAEDKQTCYKKKLEGSYNRQLYYIVDLQTDKVCHNMPINNHFKDFKVSVNGKQTTFENTYGKGIRDTKSKVTYGTVFTGNLRKIDILNPFVDKGKILVVKDSYANPIVFHIAQHYKKTVVIDIRENKKTLYDLVKDEHYDSILFLYNDTNLLGNMYEFGKAPLD